MWTERERGRVQNRTEQRRQDHGICMFLLQKPCKYGSCKSSPSKIKTKKATFAIPSINFLTSQKHPPLSNFILIYFYFNPQIMFLIFYLTNLIQPKGKSLINLLCFKTWIIIYLITEFVFDFDWV